MFNKSKSDLDVAIDEATLRVLKSDDEDERKVHLTTLERLHELKNASRSKPLSLDTAVMAGANLLGIGIIVGHERAHVIGSKALSLIMKMR